MSNEAIRSNLINRGFIYIGSTIDDNISQEICENILYLNTTPDIQVDKIKLIINSPGGYLNSCFSIVDMMEWSRLEVETIGLGTVCSGGLIIFMAGSDRILTQNTSILSHQLSSKLSGTYSDLISSKDRMDINYNMIVSHYKKYTGLKSDIIKKELLKETDTWLTPKEAIKYNLADRISKTIKT